MRPEKRQVVLGAEGLMRHHLKDVGWVLSDKLDGSTADP